MFAGTEFSKKQEINLKKKLNIDDDHLVIANLVMGYPLVHQLLLGIKIKNLLFGNKLKVLIINHCAHNKGDNSVL